MTNYQDLKNLLVKLFNQLHFPMGGSNEGNNSIWMEEPNRALTAIATEKGYVVVSSRGDFQLCRTIEEVENAFLVYFTVGNSLQNILNTVNNTENVLKPCIE